MAIPSECEFVLLGCSPSNMESGSYPFLVVQKRTLDQKSFITNHILNGWQSVRKVFADEVREDVLFFIDSLRDYKEGSAAERFFTHLSNLSVGPIRFIAGGSGRCDAIDEEIAAALDSGEHPVLWPDSFSPM